MEFVIIFQLAFWVACLVIILYLIAKRLDEKRNENFEDRDN